MIYAFHLAMISKLFLVYLSFHSMSSISFSFHSYFREKTKMYEIFEALLKERGVTTYQVAKATGISTASFSGWKQGKWNFKQDKLQKIADYFDVSLEYLMTGKGDSEEKKNPYSDIKGVYLSYAKEAQESGIDPDDIRLALDTIKRLRGEK